MLNAEGLANSSRYIYYIAGSACGQYEANPEF